MNAWHGFNMLFYGALVFWTIPAVAWWLTQAYRLLSFGVTKK